jgi:hypothetical protein
MTPEGDQQNNPQAGCGQRATYHASGGEPRSGDGDAGVHPEPVPAHDVGAYGEVSLPLTTRVPVVLTSMRKPEPLVMG